MRILDSIKTLSLICFFIALDVNAEFTTNTLTINSLSIEIRRNENEIIFNGGVFIKSKDFEINADNAIYNNKNKIVSVSGAPSRINSTYEDNIFIGSADRIVFSETNEVQLIGNAQMNYENIDISSNEISFSLQDGKITTNN
ncbi:LptA/OstA family protein [Gammaproteobacteria bacterium]|nr:LptA/OstA family protein [Gammaproteobacteria bacterium]MDA9146290.1 LptA/OstA family protein [Gammaproteobacteria bacterium]MDA9903680.1 LptA/OstA family protein [Gammaproteobacteria bacterium]